MLQPQQNEFCKQPVNLETDPSPVKPGDKKSLGSHLNGSLVEDPSKPRADSGPTEMVR